MNVFNNAIDKIAVVAYGMKEQFLLDVVGQLPLSDDQNVSRRFDFGVNKHTDEIPFFSVTDKQAENQSEEIYAMCGNLGQGSGYQCTTL